MPSTTMEGLVLIQTLPIQLMVPEMRVGLSVCLPAEARGMLDAALSAVPPQLGTLRASQPSL